MSSNHNDLAARPPDFSPMKGRPSVAERSTAGAPVDLSADGHDGQNDASISSSKLDDRVAVPLEAQQRALEGANRPETPTLAGPRAGTKRARFIIVSSGSESSEPEALTHTQGVRVGHLARPRKKGAPPSGPGSGPGHKPGSRLKPGQNSGLLQCLRPSHPPRPSSEAVLLGKGTRHSIERIEPTEPSARRRQPPVQGAGTAGTPGMASTALHGQGAKERERPLVDSSTLVSTTDDEVPDTLARTPYALSGAQGERYSRGRGDTSAAAAPVDLLTGPMYG